MKLVLRVLLVFAMVLCQLNQQLLMTEADDTGINSSNGKPQSCTIYYVDYYDGKKEKNPVKLNITYDEQGRVLDDGLAYHFYDGNNREINLASPGYVYPIFQISHAYVYYGGLIESDCQYTFNSFGSPEFIKSSYETMNFTYHPNGDVNTITFTEMDRVYVSTFEYSGNRVSRVVSKAADSGTYWQKSEWTYHYDGDNLAYIDCELYAKGHDGVYTNGRQVFTHNGSNQLTSILNTSAVDTSFVSEAKYYHYDSKGNLTDMEYYHMGEGEEGTHTYYEDYESASAKIKSIYPETGKEGRFPNQITITFRDNNIIEGINKRSANIYICDCADDKVVYSAGKGQDVRSRGNLLYFKKNVFVWTILQSNSPFEDGHSYYLKMDDDFIKFKDVEEGIGISDPKKWIHHMPEAQYEHTEGPFNKRINFTFTRSKPRPKEEYGTTYADYNELCFEHSSYQYDDELATVSMCMAMASYNTLDITRGYENIGDFLGQLEFKNIYVNNDYKHSTNHDSTGVIIGEKQLRDGTILIAVGIRSGNYNNEWGGNFNVGESGDHVGFSTGRDNVIRELKQYFSSSGKGRDIKGKIKIWIAGYSRGSAIANLTAASLDDGVNLGNNVSYDASDVYAYCFEVPNTTVSSSAHSSKYGNIFCIINPNDVVTRLPLAQWGFTHYGNELMIPSQDTDKAAFKRYSDKVITMFKSQFYHSGIDTVYVDNQYYLINGLMEWLNRDVLSLATVGSDIYYGDVNLFKKGRSKYVSSLQSLLVRNAPEIMRKLESSEPEAEKEILTEFIDDVKSELLSLASMVTVKRRIKKLAIDACGASSIKMDQIDKLLEIAIYSHYSELTLCWMRTLEYTGVLDKSISKAQNNSNSSGGKMNKVSFHCPVDIAAYDADNNKIAEIKSGKVSVEEEIPLIAVYGEDGSKVFFIPEFMNIRFEITPYENGNMSVVTEVIDIVSGQTEKTDIILNADVIKNQKLEYTIDSGLSCDDYESVLINSAGEEIPVDYSIDPSNEGYCLATITVEGEGEAYGDGIVERNSFHMFTAEPGEKQKFEGWYDEGGKLLSSEPYYTVFVNDDISVTVRFVRKTTIMPVIIGTGGIAVIGLISLMFFRKKKSN